ncbi:MAG: endonuclease/exonuclease/phosphatase family protein [Gammaproteobacteria bacterium]
MSKTPASGPGRLRVLTYNVHKGYCRANRRFVLEAMRRLIADTAADLVFLQEVHGRKDPERRGGAQFPDQPHFEYIADTVWPHVAYGRNAIYREGDHGNAILSKFPLLRWENINVARFPRSSRSILHGMIELPGAAKPLHPRREAGRERSAAPAETGDGLIEMVVVAISA